MLNPWDARRATEAAGAGWQSPVARTRPSDAAGQSAMPHTGAPPSDVHAGLSGELWMVDHEGATVLRCRCLAVSATRMRLCVPVGYGVAVGQRYELSARGTGENNLFAPLVSYT